MFITTMQAESSGGEKMPAEKAEEDEKRRQKGKAKRMAREEKGAQGGKGRLRAEEKARDGKKPRVEKGKLEAAGNAKRKARNPNK